ncbi:hypothetical protein GS935_20150 [Rhodococcus hoagii]|uniref:hypothetical protein n=1 Tax=Rhodococcus hoagii TaxID=43767 RepID=UPI00111BD379|nr:hypothetical protein [Prescottella equi]NKV08557.1 hypothetical protein [Prescottella equi]NKV08582.1 hypothetical protein [Prescottella equi]NKV09558.1 hypothetical protein [Prescottella equi]NKW39035.1 hypothetical protein [Prescottella equi]
MPDSTSRPTMITREKGEDIRRYATATLTVGRNPDNPEEVRSDLVVDPLMPPICSLRLAHILRDIADHLEAVHGVEGC